MVRVGFDYGWKRAAHGSANGVLCALPALWAFPRGTDMDIPSRGSATAP